MENCLFPVCAQGQTRCPANKTKTSSENEFSLVLLNMAPSTFWKCFSSCPADVFQTFNEYKTSGTLTISHKRMTDTKPMSCSEPLPTNRWERVKAFWMPRLWGKAGVASLHRGTLEAVALQWRKQEHVSTFDCCGGGTPEGTFVMSYG